MTCTIDDEHVVPIIDDTRLTRVYHALELLAVADIDAMDRAALDEVVAARRLVVGFCDAVDVRVARRSRLLEAEGRSESAADVLCERGKRSGREAAAAAGRERACEQMPGFESALGDGTVTAGHVDALANATTKLTETQRAEFAEQEDALLKRAGTTSVEAFERECRDLARSIVADSEADDGRSELERQREKNNVRTWIDKQTGMGHVRAELDPESHARILTALHARTRSLQHRQDEATSNNPDDPVAALTHDQLEAAAFVELVTGSAAVDQRTPDVIVLIDYATLVGHWHSGSLCETVSGIPVPAETVRRHCCQANIIPVVLGSHGEPLDVGAGSRLATPAQRRGIYTMYRTCCFPGCSTPVDRCEMHHLDEWIRHRSTDLKRLVPLCVRHHHLIHDGGWGLTMTADRVITITRPDRTTSFTGATTDRQPGARAG